MMDSRFRKAIETGKVFIYMDDIIIFTEDMEEHRRLVKMVLEIMRLYKLTAKPWKCQFHKESVNYVGMVLGHGTMGMQETKVQGVSDWPTPQTKKQLESFLGTINFYRRFVKDFSAIARPLHDL
jgi:hypothetical protein